MRWSHSEQLSARVLLRGACQAAHGDGGDQEQTLRRAKAAGTLTKVSPLKGDTELCFRSFGKADAGLADTSSKNTGRCTLLGKRLPFCSGLRDGEALSA